MTSRALLVTSAAAALCASCTVTGGEAEAVWDVAPGQALGRGTVGFTALVTRLGCNNGVTGTVLDPQVEVTDDEVVVLFTVSPGEPVLGADCPGNEAVAYEVDLPGALGDRALVDGACVSGRARTTVWCETGGVRFAP